ncbi:hypothetical protein ACM614_27315 [Streptomyces sp. 12297]|uniref:hypothetical protein n=1 Tax=Streptomyces sp. NBC_00239 TaxID=2903640 RepID=UPI002E283F9E|nr:hypothetical protein [Streptomyces sp. NBC_00239]
MQYDFPPRLRALQLQLNRVRSRYLALCAELPWSAEPVAGWKADEYRYSHRGDVPDSPGYTPEQAEALAHLYRRLLRLSRLVLTDPYWQTLEGEQLVDARMALKRVEDCGT